MGQRIARQERRRSRLARLPGVRWPALAWSFLWTHGTFARRFWTVVTIGLVVYVAADVIAAAVAS